MQDKQLKCSYLILKEKSMKRKFLKAICSGVTAYALLSSSAILAQQAPAQTQQQTWRMAIPVGEKSWFGEMHKWWGSEVEKRSGGKIVVRYFWNDSLVKWADALPGIQSGIADMAWVSSTYFPAKFPHYMVLDQIFNFGDDYVAALKAATQTMENQPDLKAELAKEDIVFLMPHISGHAPAGTRQAMNSVRELKGKTLRTYGGARIDFYQALEANPVFMPFGEMYSAMDRGTIDAFGDMAIVLSNAFKLQEVIRHVHMVNPPGAKGNGGALASGFFMTGQKFRALPKETQTMLMQLRAEYTERYGRSLMELEEQIKIDWAKKHKIVFHTSSPEDERYLVERGGMANEALFKKQEAQGNKNVRAVWAYFQDSRRKFEAAGSVKR
jgi:TRAP-type C4-dicarboxylate transport system substrate-binding protein